MSKGIEKVAELGNTLVDLAKEVGGEAFPMMVEHTKAQALAGLFVSSAIVLIAATVMVIAVARLRRDLEGDFAAGFSLVVLALASMGIASNLPDYLNPVGATIKQILRSIG